MGERASMFQHCLPTERKKLYIGEGGNERNKP